jgi:HlyD family secretion protein
LKKCYFREVAFLFDMPNHTTESRVTKDRYHHYVSVNYRGYKLYWFILVMLFLGFASLPFISVDVSVQSRGVITSVNKMISINSPLTSKVIEVNIKENDFVKTGDTLVVLHQEGIINEIKINQHQVDIQQIYVDDLGLLLEKNGRQRTQSSLFNKEQEEYISELEKRQRKVKKLNVDFERTASLFADGVLPLTNFQEDSFKLSEAKDELIAFKASTFAKWESDRKNYILAIHELEGRIESLKQQQSQYAIIAPFTGSIIDFKGVAAGNFINENQLIAYLSPQEELIAECYISPVDIGYIREGMQVRLQIDTYDYNQWGLLDAVVFDVADDVALINQEYRYLIRCRLSKNYLSLSNGSKGSMKKGMSLTGRFIVTQRTLLQLLFDNVDDWLNPKIVNSLEETKN